MTLGKPDAGKPLVRFDEGRSETVIGLVPPQPVRSAYSTFVDSPILAALRSRLGIKSRSEPSKWKLRGTTEGTNRPGEVIFESGGNVDIHYRKPVEFDA